MAANTLRPHTGILICCPGRGPLETSMRQRLSISKVVESVCLSNEFLEERILVTIERLLRENDVSSAFNPAKPLYR